MEVEDRRWACRVAGGVYLIHRAGGLYTVLVVLGRTTSWSPKSYCVYGPENEIAAVTFFTKTSTALTNRSAFASPTEWQDPGEHRC